jgi:subtilase family protein
MAIDDVGLCGGVSGRCVRRVRSFVAGASGRDWTKCVRSALFILAISVMAISAIAQPVNATLQVFISVDGSAPDWLEMTLTATRLQLGGVDATTGRRFVLTAFEGARQLSIPRTAAGSARFLVTGASPPGRVDQIALTIEGASLTTQPPNDTTRPRVVPLVVRDNVLRLQPLRPLTLNAAETQSIVVAIRLGTDIVLARDDVLAFRPVLAAVQFTPGPSNFLNGGEILTTGPTQTFPELGIQVVRAKIVNPASGSIRDLTLQANTGASVSFTELRNQNEALWRSRHGSLHPMLVQRLASLSSTDSVLVDVWLRVPGPLTLLTNAGTPEAWDVAHSAFVTSRRTAAEPTAAALTATLIAAGATILSTELNPAVLHISASREVLESTVASLSDVLEVVETPAEGAILATKGAVDLVQTPLWLAHLLLSGQGLRMALIEPRACVNTSHEAFRGVFFEEPVGFPCTNTGGNAGHSTAVAGALAAAVGAPGSIELVGLFQARMFTSDTCRITDATLARNPHLINLSCEVSNTSSSRRLLDHAVFGDRIFVANGAGNVDNGQDSSMLPVFCPSYNSACIGSYLHNDTLGPENFGDDVPVHRWLNDPATQREKPDLVGPNAGSFPSWNDNDDYDGWGGTSFATPLVVGTAGLLIANAPHLVRDPTLTRAVLLASARHTFQGFATVPIFGDNVDDRAGAGAPRGDRALEVLKGDQFFSKLVERDSDFDSADNLNSPVVFPVNAGDRVRVVLTYDQCQDSMISIPDVLLADLDLVVTENSIDGTRQVRANNSHVDNSEIVEFTAANRALITANTHVQHWDACTDGSRQTHLAITWDVLPATEK